MTEKELKRKEQIRTLGQIIATIRRMKGMTQKQLAEKAEIQHWQVEWLESPRKTRTVSMEHFYQIIEALEVPPEDIIKLASQHDGITESCKSYLECRA